MQNASQQQPCFFGVRGQGETTPVGHNWVPAGRGSTSSNTDEDKPNRSQTYHALSRSPWLFGSWYLVQDTKSLLIEWAGRFLCNPTCCFLLEWTSRLKSRSSGSALIVDKLYRFAQLKQKCSVEAAAVRAKHHYRQSNISHHRQRAAIKPVLEQTCIASYLG